MTEEEYLDKEFRRRAAKVALHPTVANIVRALHWARDLATPQHDEDPYIIHLSYTPSPNSYCGVVPWRWSERINRVTCLDCLWADYQDIQASLADPDSGWEEADFAEEKAALIKRIKQLDKKAEL